MTLVEVVAGLALLASLLVALLLATARHTRQSADAERRLRAAAAADALLTGWWQDRANFPRAAAGRVTGDPDLSWRTRVVPNATLTELRAQVVRLEVSDDRVGGPLVSVDVVLDVTDPDDAVPQDSLE